MRSAWFPAASQRENMNSESSSSGSSVPTVNRAGGRPATNCWWNQLIAVGLMTSASSGARLALGAPERSKPPKVRLARLRPPRGRPDRPGRGARVSGSIASGPKRSGSNAVPVWMVAIACSLAVQRSRRPALSVPIVSAMRLARVSGRFADSIQRTKFLR
jgi:hypothetical protein